MRDARVVAKPKPEEFIAAYARLQRSALPGASTGERLEATAAWDRLSVLARASDGDAGDPVQPTKKKDEKESMPTSPTSQEFDELKKQVDELTRQLKAKPAAQDEQRDPPADQKTAVATLKKIIADPESSDELKDAARAGLKLLEKTTDNEEGETAKAMDCAMGLRLKREDRGISLAGGGLTFGTMTQEEAKAHLVKLEARDSRYTRSRG